MALSCQDPAGLKNALAAAEELWRYWGFETWGQGGLRGVSRRQQFVKDGLLGPIAEYRAWDYIIWESGRPEDREALWDSLRSRPEVMTQRFLFILPETWPGRRIRSFWLGFRGYAEFYAYWPLAGSSHGQLPVDLTGLVDLALKPDRPPGGPPTRG